MAIDFGNGPQIKSRAIQGAKVDVQIGDTSAYGSLANNPLEGLTIPSEKDEFRNQTTCICYWGSLRIFF